MQAPSPSPCESRGDTCTCTRTGTGTGTGTGARARTCNYDGNEVSDKSNEIDDWSQHFRELVAADLAKNRRNENEEDDGQKQAMELCYHGHEINEPESGFPAISSTLGGMDTEEFLESEQEKKGKKPIEPHKQRQRKGVINSSYISSNTSGKIGGNSRNSKKNDTKGNNIQILTIVPPEVLVNLLDFLEVTDLLALETTSTTIHLAVHNMLNKPGLPLELRSRTASYRCSVGLQLAKCPPGTLGQGHLSRRFQELIDRFDTFTNISEGVHAKWNVQYVTRKAIVTWYSSWSHKLDRLITISDGEIHNVIANAVSLHARDNRKKKKQVNRSQSQSRSRSQSQSRSRSQSSKHKQQQSSRNWSMLKNSQPHELKLPQEQNQEQQSSKPQQKRNQKPFLYRTNSIGSAPTLENRNKKYNSDLSDEVTDNETDNYWKRRRSSIVAASLSASETEEMASLKDVLHGEFLLNNGSIKSHSASFFSKTNEAVEQEGTMDPAMGPPTMTNCTNEKAKPRLRNKSKSDGSAATSLNESFADVSGFLNHARSNSCTNALTSTSATLRSHHACSKAEYKDAGVVESFNTRDSQMQNDPYGSTCPESSEALEDTVGVPKRVAKCKTMQLSSSSSLNSSSVFSKWFTDNEESSTNRPDILVNRSDIVSSKAHDFLGDDDDDHGHDHDDDDNDNDSDDDDDDEEVESDDDNDDDSNIEQENGEEMCYVDGVDDDDDDDLVSEAASLEHVEVPRIVPIEAPLAVQAEAAEAMFRRNSHSSASASRMEFTFMEFVKIADVVSKENERRRAILEKFFLVDPQDGRFSLTREGLSVCRSFFRFFDEDNDGALSRVELENLNRAAGQPLTDAAFEWVCHAFECNEVGLTEAGYVGMFLDNILRVPELLYKDLFKLELYMKRRKAEQLREDLQQKVSIQM